MTNYETFGDLALAKRCLYLFAATPFNDEGLLPACCYEKPEILSGGNAIRDFSQIYAAALFDYVKASGDIETGLELLPVALKQFELSLRELDPKTALYIPPMRVIRWPRWTILPRYGISSTVSHS